MIAGKVELPSASAISREDTVARIQILAENGKEMLQISEKA